MRFSTAASQKNMWRTALLFLLSFILIAAIALPLFEAQAASSAVTTDALNLRSGPGTGYSIVLTIPKGQSITVNGTADNGWYQVTTSSGKTGYVSPDYVRITSAAESLEATCTGNDVRLRSGPGTGYSTLSYIKKGTALTVLDRSNASWYKVSVGGTTGYMSSSYVQIKSAATPAPTTAPSPTPGTTEGVAATCTGSAVRVRKGPGTSYSIVASLDKNEKITVYDQSNKDWFYISTSKGVYGYTSSTYVKISSTATPAPTPTAKPTATPTAKPTATPTAKPTATPTPAATSLGTAVTTDNLRLRSGAGTKYDTITVLAKGAKLTLLDMSDSTWYKVSTSSGQVGYCSSEYLKVTLTGSTVTGVTTGSDLRVRSGPGTSYSTVTYLAKGVTVTVLDRSNSSWYQISTAAGVTGYVSSSYIEIRENAPTTAPTATPTAKPTATPTAKPTATPTPTAKPVDPNMPPYAKVTTGLNLRKEPSTSAGIICVLPTGTIVSVLDNSDPAWTKVSYKGDTGYVSTEYITFLKEGDVAADIDLSSTTVTVPQYKTVYISANTSVELVWSTSDSSIATVDGGFVYAAGQGTAVISCTDASTGTSYGQCIVTVSAPEAIRFAYSDPNVIDSGESFNLLAVTDENKTAVKFVVNVNGTEKTYIATEYETETYEHNVARVWKTPVILEDAGYYTVKAYSESNGAYSSSSFTFDLCVVSTHGVEETSNDPRRASDAMLDWVKAYEGYLPEVYADTLANGIPTVGYGITLRANDQFYNGLTESEAEAMLVNEANGSYAAAINRFIDTYDVKMNQAQFDGLLSFTYNIGTSYWNKSSFDVGRILRNNVVIPEGFFDSNRTGYVNYGEGTALFAAADIYSDVLDSYVAHGTSLKVLNYTYDSANRRCWYKVSVDGLEGWMHSGAMALDDASSLTIDLTQLDSSTIAAELLLWHTSGGSCRSGLLYRRLAEAKIITFANYSEAVKTSSNYKHNTYDFDYPSCMAGYER